MGNVHSPQHYAIHGQDTQASQAHNTRVSDPHNVLHILNTGGRAQDEHLGGLRADLASLLAFPYRAPLQSPPSIHETTTVKANVNLNKDSLQLVKDDNQYILKFVYDAYTPCTVKVYFAAREMSLGVIQARAETPPVIVEKGFGASYSQALGQLFDIASYNPDEIVATPASTTFPIIITMDSVIGDGEKVDATKPVILSQTTFTTLLHCADDTYAIKVVKQKLPYLGNTYNLHEIFGLDYTGERENEGSRECVVCLSEPRDTTILPCNHMCLCAACAELMRTQTNKCPICRAPVKKLLSIHMSGLYPAEPLAPPLEPVSEEDFDEKEDTLSRREKDKP